MGVQRDRTRLFCASVLAGCVACAAQGPLPTPQPAPLVQQSAPRPAPIPPAEVSKPLEGRWSLVLLLDPLSMRNLPNAEEAKGEIAFGSGSWWSNSDRFGRQHVDLKPFFGRLYAPPDGVEAFSPADTSMFSEASGGIIGDSISIDFLPRIDHGGVSLWGRFWGDSARGTWRRRGLEGSGTFVMRRLSKDAVSVAAIPVPKTVAPTLASNTDTTKSTKPLTKAQRLAAARAARIAKQKATRDSIAEAKATRLAKLKATNDSIAAAKATRIAKQKAIADSIAAARVASAKPAPAATVASTPAAATPAGASSLAATAAPSSPAPATSTSASTPPLLHELSNPRPTATTTLASNTTSSAQPPAAPPRVASTSAAPAPTSSASTSSASTSVAAASNAEPASAGVAMRVSEATPAPADPKAPVAIRVRLFDKGSNKYIATKYSLHVPDGRWMFGRLRTADSADGFGPAVNGRPGRYEIEITDFMCGDKIWFLKDRILRPVDVKPGEPAEVTIETDLANAPARPSFDNKTGAKCSAPVGSENQ